MVITSASHAEGREFEPRQNLFLQKFVLKMHFLGLHLCKNLDELSDESVIKSAPLQIKQKYSIVELYNDAAN